MKHKLIALTAYFTTMFMPIVPALLWLGFFIAVDLFTGIWKAKTQNEPIQSKKLGNTVTKIVMYFLAVICGHVMDTTLLHLSFLPFTIAQAVISFISITEFKSIVENISAILGMPLDKYLRDKIDALRNN